MASQNRMTFINIHVRSLAASREFFGKLGFGFDPKFTNDTTGCMVISEGSTYAMLHERESFERFTTKPIADASQVTELILAVSAEDREAVDAFADAALAAGGTPARDPEDYGFMYQRSFNDLDGHYWEVAWMSQEAVEQGPSDIAENA